MTTDDANPSVRERASRRGPRPAPLAVAALGRRIRWVLTERVVGTRKAVRGVATMGTATEDLVQQGGHRTARSDQLLLGKEEDKDPHGDEHEIGG